MYKVVSIQLQSLQNQPIHAAANFIIQYEVFQFHDYTHPDNQTTLYHMLPWGYTIESQFHLEWTKIFVVIDVYHFKHFLLLFLVSDNIEELDTSLIQVNASKAEVNAKEH